MCYLNNLGPVNSTIDNSVSDTIKRSSEISLTKNIALPEQNIESITAATKFENGNGKSTTCIWPKPGYFKQQPCDFHMDKENFPENSVIYINQGYLLTKDNKKLYYADYYIVGQVIECINPPGDISNYVCKDRGVKVYRPQDDLATGQFLGLYESLGFLVVRGNQDGHFLDMDIAKKNPRFCNR